MPKQLSFLSLAHQEVILLLSANVSEEEGNIAGKGRPIQAKINVS